MAGGLVDDRHGCLRLNRISDELAPIRNLVREADDLRLVGRIGRVRFFLGGEIDGVILVRRLIIGQHGLVAVIVVGPVRMLDRQAEGNGNLGVVLVVFGIINFLFNNGLKLGVFGGIDGKAAAVEQAVGLGLIIPLLLHQVVDNLVGQGIHEVIRRIVRDFIVHDGNTGVDVVSNGCVVFALVRNKAQLQHLLQDLLAAGVIVLGVLQGVVLGRILGDGRDTGRLGKGEVTDRLIEIALARRLDAKRILPQVDGIQVVFKDGLLAGDLFELNGQVLLLDLPVDFLLGRGFGGPVREVVVLQELLGNGRGALGKMPGGQSRKARPEDAPDIDAVVLVETLVLDGHESLLYIVGNLVDGHVLPIGPGSRQGLDFAPVLVVDGRKIAGGRNINRGNVGQLVNQALGVQASADHRRRHEDDEEDQNRSQEGEKEGLSRPAPGGMGSGFPLFYILFTVIHMKR